MNKLIVVLLVAGVTAGGLVLLRSAPTGGAEAASKFPEGHSAVSAVGPDVAGRAETEPKVPQAAVQGAVALSAGVPADGGVTDDEEAVLDMYDEMVASFEQHAGNCSAIADAVRTAVTAHTVDLQRLRAAAKQRGAQQASEAEGRLAFVAGARMERFRTLANKAVQSCSQELMPEFKKLSEIEGAP